MALAAQPGRGHRRMRVDVDVRPANGRDSSPGAGSRIAAVVVFALLLAGFWAEFRDSAIAQPLREHIVSAFLCLALLLAPLWFFGFGAANVLRSALGKRWQRVAVASLGCLPYLVFSIPRHEFHWLLAAAMAGYPVVLAAVLAYPEVESGFSWRDALVLLSLAAVLELRLLTPAWPYMGLGSLPKLYLADVALYLYLVVRGIEGMGYSLVPGGKSFLIAAREWAFFAPFGIGLGLALEVHSFSSPAAVAQPRRRGRDCYLSANRRAGRAFLSRHSAKSAGNPAGPKRSAGSHLCALRPFALPQRCHVQLAICFAGRNRRNLLWPGMARRAKDSDFRNDAHCRRCRLGSMVQVVCGVDQSAMTPGYTIRGLESGSRVGVSGTTGLSWRANRGPRQRPLLPLLGWKSSHLLFLLLKNKGWLRSGRHDIRLGIWIHRHENCFNHRYSFRRKSIEGLNRRTCRNR